VTNDFVVGMMFGLLIALITGITMMGDASRMGYSVVIDGED
jgi:hypothetical protein